MSASGLGHLRSVTGQSSFTEHGNLTSIQWHPFAATMSGADHGQHRQRFESGARHENSLSVGAQVGGVDQKTLSHGQVKIIWHHAFQNFVVLELELYPQSLGSRTSG